MNETIDKDNPQRDRNIGGNYISGDQAGGNIVKDNAAGGNIAGGDNISATVSGSTGVVNVGKNITTGDIMVNLDQSIKQNPNNEYLKGLKEITDQLSKEYEQYNVPEAKRNNINQSIQDLQTEVKDIKPTPKVEDKPTPKVENLSLSKQITIEAKTTTLVEKIFDALPQASETIANLIPFLSPFSKVIRGGVESLVNAYKK